MGEKFIQLTPQVYHYALQHSSNSDDPLVRELREETQALGDISGMQIGVDQGLFIQILVAALGVREALEIGTFTGYSALCVARSLPQDGRLLCLDISDEWTSIGRPFWERAGVASKIELRMGHAVELLNQLEPDRTFDFAFIDADKVNYDNYYEAVLPRMRPGGVLLFDNMLRGGRLAEGNVTSEDDIALQALNVKLTHDERVENVLLPFGDGIQFCRKK
jgi:caffeoyl-CoA O-methyltransferase